MVAEVALPALFSVGVVLDRPWALVEWAVVVALVLVAERPLVERVERVASR